MADPARAKKIFEKIFSARRLWALFTVKKFRRIKNLSLRIVQNWKFSQKFDVTSFSKNFFAFLNKIWANLGLFEVAFDHLLSNIIKHFYYYYREHFLLREV